MCRNGRRSAHYFFNDKPIHILTDGVFKEEVDHSKRYGSNGRKCKTCSNILKAYSKIGIAERLN